MQWMKALTCATYDYMKLMIADLQRQVDKIEGRKGEKVVFEISKIIMKYSMELFSAETTATTK